MADPATAKAAGQSSFVHALLDPDQPAPAGLTGPNGKRADKRFAVYRNNVVSSLVTALADIFPTVQRLVGEDYFRAMARLHVIQEQPASPLLFEYGQGFANFIAAFEPARHLTFLADVARLERLWLDVFHEADCPPLDAGVLAQIDPEKLPLLKFTAHPAMRIFQSGHAAVSILSRDRSGQSLEGLDPVKAEDGLLTRPHHDVELRYLPAGGALFLGMLRDGHCLGDAATAAIEANPELDLPAAIQTMLQAGCFTALSD